MKPLPPSLREKKRYLLIEGKNLKENVDKAILEFIGVLGMAKVCPKWIKLNGNRGILSVNRESLHFVKGAFVLFPKKIEVKKVSGTLKKLKKEF